MWFHRPYNIFLLGRNLSVLKKTITYELKFSSFYRNLHRILKFLKIVQLDLGTLNIILLA